MLSTLLKARKDDYKTVDEGNKKIWLENSCNQAIINKAEELLERTKNAIYPVDFTQRSTDELKSGQLAIIHRDQLPKISFPLNIPINLGLDHYLITHK